MSSQSTFNSAKGLHKAYSPGPTVNIGRVLLWSSLFVNSILSLLILSRSVALDDLSLSGLWGAFKGKAINQHDIENTSETFTKARRCPAYRAKSAIPPAPTNPWAPLDVHETTAIQSWLEAPERHLNLTKACHAKISDNVIDVVERYYPPKDDTLAYLERPTEVPAPQKFAKVVINHGGWREPGVRSYLVGPLPIGRQTSIRPLMEIYRRDGKIPFNARGLNSFTEIPLFVAGAVAPIAHAIEDLFGASVKGLTNDTLTAGLTGPFSYDGSFRRLWVTWRRNVAGSFLLPVNFYQYVDISGSDPSQWKVLKTMYHGQLFTTFESFLEAYNNGTLIRHPEQADSKLDHTWTQRTRTGQDRDLDHLPGPRSVSFAGPRYRVDPATQHVSWLGWQIYLGFDRDMGLNLWDIRFRGERIIYQLAPQDCLAQYAGNDPVQATTAWLDRYFGMGALVRDLIPHYDCPQEATYLPATTYTSMGTLHVQRAICVFEQDTGKPLSRHLGFEEGESGAIKSYVLTVRSISTVAKQFDYNFYLDGSIEVRLSASGYLQSGFWNTNQDGYGTRIHATTLGTVHDHVINFKVDFDIAGRHNSLLKISTKQEEVEHSWLDDDWGQTVIQQKILNEYINNENDALLKYPANLQGGYAIVNQEATNKWGLPRGYAIHPGNSPIHSTVVGSKRMQNNANWALYNLAVSRQKETEPSSSSMWNLQLPGDPMVNFHDFFDGENITQQDLVAWINVGMHHLPTAEDSPMTKTTLATSSFSLTPLNYFGYDVSMDLKNAVLLHEPKKRGEAFGFDDNGVPQDLTCLPDPPAPFEYKEANML